MPKKKSLTKNYIFNLIYQIVAIITPLATAPYLARVLGSDGIGKYSFVASLVSYFVLFANLGFNIYAQRTIARDRENVELRSKLFVEISLCKLITTIAALGVNFALVFSNVYGDYNQLMLIMSIEIASSFFDVTFFFQGIEEFGIIAIKNIIIKLLGIALIFIFVKGPNDVWIYCLCHVLTVIVSAISLWFSLPKYLCKFDKKGLSPFKHLVPSLRLFIPTIAITIYTIVDKTLIGVLVPGTMEKVVDGTLQTVKVADVENGYYAQAEQIVKMIMTVLTAYGTVVMPRNAYYFKENRIAEAKENITKSFSFYSLLGSPMMFGLAAVSITFVPWFLGPNYEKVPYLIMLLAPLILIIGFNTILGNQYLISCGKDKIYTISVCAGAVVNIICNCILIPYLYAYGAALGTIIAEFTILLIQGIYLRKELNFKQIFLSNIKYFVLGLVMFVPIILLGLYMEPTIKTTLVLVCLGIVVYFSLLFIFKDKNLYTAINKVKNGIGHRHEKE